MSATADIDKVQTAKTGVRSIFEIAARADRAAVVVTRLGLIVVLLWIGGLKVFKYEAVSIVPLVANSPLMSFFYADPDHYNASSFPI
jgi:reactive chlorine resistance protein C